MKGRLGLGRCLKDLRQQVAERVRPDVAREQPRSVNLVDDHQVALAVDEDVLPAVAPGEDTLFCESEVLEKRESKTKLDRGTVRVHTRVLNQDGVLVAEFKRLVLVPRKEHGTPE